MTKERRFELLTRIAEVAAEATREKMHWFGVKLVYYKDSIIVEELPDGTIRPLRDGDKCGEQDISY